MADHTVISPAEIRIAQQENPKLRERDLAEKLGIREAQLVAANCGHGVIRIDAHPDVIMDAAQQLGEVMALTRNESCVSEKVGTYDNYHPGKHAAMILTEEIDLRIFPAQWKHGFMVEKPLENGVRKSLQVFDAAGDAVHKIFLRETSDHAAWDRLKTELAADNQDGTLVVDPRKPVESAKANPDQASALRENWAQMTDTHQFRQMTQKLKMNRLGAYRVVGAPFAQLVKSESIDIALQKLAQDGTEIMIFVGNMGCIQIHTGPVNNLKAMGPWQNVLDPGFDMHLRLDHIAEVWVVEKPTKRGPAKSLEAFDAEGGLILQIFGIGRDGRDSRQAWHKILSELPSAETEANV